MRRPLEDVEETPILLTKSVFKIYFDNGSGSHSTDNPESLYRVVKVSIHTIPSTHKFKSKDPPEKFSVAPGIKRTTAAVHIDKFDCDLSFVGASGGPFRRPHQPGHRLQPPCPKEYL